MKTPGPDRYAWHVRRPEGPRQRPRVLVEVEAAAHGSVIGIRGGTTLASGANGGGLATGHQKSGVGLHHCGLGGWAGGRALTAVVGGSLLESARVRYFTTTKPSP